MSFRSALLAVFVLQCRPLLPRNGSWLGLHPGPPSVEARRLQRTEIVAYVFLVVCLFGTATSSYLLFIIESRDIQITLGITLLNLLISATVLVVLIVHSRQKSVLKVRRIYFFLCFLSHFILPIVGAILDSGSISTIHIVMTRRLFLLCKAVLVQGSFFGQVSVSLLLLTLPGNVLYLVKVCLHEIDSIGADVFIVNSDLRTAIALATSPTPLAIVWAFAIVVGSMLLRWLGRRRAKVEPSFPTNSIVPSSCIGANSHPIADESPNSTLENSCHDQELAVPGASSRIAADEAPDSTLEKCSHDQVLAVPGIASSEKVNPASVQSGAAPALLCNSVARDVPGSMETTDGSGLHQSAASTDMRAANVFSELPDSTSSHSTPAANVAVDSHDVGSGGSPSLQDFCDESSCQASMTSHSSFGLPNESVDEHKFLTPGDVVKFRQTMRDEMLVMDYMLDDSILQLESEWKSAKNLLDRLSSFITDWEYNFPLLARPSQPLHEMRELIHTISGAQEYSKDVSSHLLNICNSAQWNEWELLLGGLTVRSLSGECIFNAPLQDAVHFTVGQVKHQIFLKTNVSTNFQQLSISGRLLQDDEHFRILHNEHGPASFANVSYVALMGRLSEVLGSWRLFDKSPAVVYENNLSRICIHTGGCTDSTGHILPLSIAEDGFSLLLDARQLSIRHFGLTYVAPSGVIHNFCRCSDEA